MPNNPVQVLRSSLVDNRPAGKQPGEPYVNYADMQFGVVDTSGTPLDLLAVTFFSATSHYDIGEFVFQAGNLYRAIAGNGPGAFTPANWSRLVTVSDGNGVFLPVAGGTMTGPIVLAADPAAPMQAATKQYSDLKAPLASPVFTGDPQAPTAAPGDNDASIATTAFVNTALGNSGVVVSDTAPVAPPQGKMWFDSVGGQLYVRYDDGNSAQWVVAVNNSPDLPVASAVNPVMNGVAAPGAATQWSRGDHVHPSDTNKLSLSGGTLTGPLAVPQLNVSNAAGTSRVLTGMTGVSARWSIELGNTTAESGGAVGSDFVIDRYNDAGAYIDAPLAITRSSGLVSIPSSTLTNTQIGTVTNQPIIGSGVASVKQTTGDVVLNLSSNVNSALGQFMWQVATGYVIMYSVTSGGQAFIRADGVFQITSATAFKPGGGSWTAPSDARIKNVLGDYMPGLAEVIQLRPVNYTYKANDTPIADVNEAVRAEGVPKSTVTEAPYPASPHYQAAVAAKEFVGLVAQEVEGVFPGMVTQEAGFIDGEPVADLRNLDTTPLIFALVNAVKELKAEIEALKAGAR